MLKLLQKLVGCEAKLCKRKNQRRGRMASAFLVCAGITPSHAPIKNKDDFIQKPSLSLSYIRIGINLIAVDKHLKVQMRTC